MYVVGTPDDEINSYVYLNPIDMTRLCLLGAVALCDKSGNPLLEPANK
jgi:hypothetical protein